APYLHVARRRGQVETLLESVIAQLWARAGTGRRVASRRVIPWNISAPIASEVGSSISAGSSVCASSASLNCRCETRLVFAGVAEADGAGRPGRLHELSSNASASPTAQLARPI